MSTIEFDGQDIPLSSFSKIIIQKGQPALFNPELKLMIEFDVDNKEQLTALGISEITVQQVMLQLERDRQLEWCRMSTKTNSVLYLVARCSTASIRKNSLMHSLRKESVRI